MEIIIPILFLGGVGIFVISAIVQYAQRDRKYTSVRMPTIVDSAPKTEVFVDRFVDDFAVDQIKTKKKKGKDKDKEEEFA